MSQHWNKIGQIGHTNKVVEHERLFICHMRESEVDLARLNFPFPVFSCMYEKYVRMLLSEFCARVERDFARVPAQNFADEAYLGLDWDGANWIGLQNVRVVVLKW